jgi:thiol:disulfide interchange protein
MRAEKNFPKAAFSIMYIGVKNWWQKLVVLLSLVSASAFGAQTKVGLVLSADTARPGETVMAGITMDIPEGWHSYWRNPGGPGIAPSIDWTLPKGVTAGGIMWPIPEKEPIFTFLSYVYGGKIMLLVPLKVDPSAAAGPLEIKGRLNWQECDASVCVPAHEAISAQLAVGPEAKTSKDAASIDAAKSKVPLIDPALAVSVHWENEDAEKRLLVIEWPSTKPVAEADFFPYAADKFEVQGETERLPEANGKIRIRKAVTKSEGEWPDKISGVLTTRVEKGGAESGYEVTLAAPAFAGATAEIPKQADTSLIVMLLFAFIGGLILNIMPCVLPVIALKVLGFVSQAHESPGRVRKLGLIYGLGVLFSFLILAGLAIGVQRAGGLASWSTPFQNPQFRVVITVLITLVALNLFGVFEITLSGRAMGAAGDLTAKKGPAGAFFNGMLATVLATPCTAPFLAGAIGFAFTQPSGIIVLVFLFVGVGLAAPFVLLCWNPAWLKLLPKPGMWMQRFKVAMGFPMLATAIWLFWFTATRLGKSGVLWFGLFLVVLAAAAWVWGEFVQRGAKRAGLAMVASLVLLAGGYGYILENKLQWRAPSGARKQGIEWQIWSAQAVEKARKEGHPVLVDFTADSCVNCQVNKAIAIEITSTREKLSAIGAVAMEADFTDEDPAIARELKKYGRPGVPLVLVYPADVKSSPIVLPPALTPGIVHDALDKASGKAAPGTSALNR